MQTVSALFLICQISVEETFFCCSGRGGNLVSFFFRIEYLSKASLMLAAFYTEAEWLNCDNWDFVFEMSQ